MEYNIACRGAYDLSKPRLGPVRSRSSSVSTAGKDVLARFVLHGGSDVPPWGFLDGALITTGRMLYIRPRQQAQDLPADHAPPPRIAVGKALNGIGSRSFTLHAPMRELPRGFPLQCLCLHPLDSFRWRWPAYDAAQRTPIVPPDDASAHNTGIVRRQGRCLDSGRGAHLDRYRYGRDDFLKR
jgi:hypothetical protein